MATGADHTETVISKIAGGGVVEVYSCPVRRVMAFVTLQTGHKMSGENQSGLSMI
jgi:hypothetical protein